MLHALQQLAQDGILTAMAILASALIAYYAAQRGAAKGAQGALEAVRLQQQYEAERRRAEYVAYLQQLRDELQLADATIREEAGRAVPMTERTKLELPTLEFARLAPSHLALALQTAVAEDRERRAVQVGVDEVRKRVVNYNQWIEPAEPRLPQDDETSRRLQSAAQTALQTALANVITAINHALAPKRS